MQKTSQDATKKLKILACNPDGGAFYYIMEGIGHAFKDLGHEFRNWKGTDEELKNYMPDIYLGCSGWRQNYPKWARDEYNTKIGIHINPWGSTILKALPGESNINESDEAKKWVLSQKPHFGYCYGNDEDISHMWNRWNDINVKMIPMPTAGNSIIYKPTNQNNNFKCDVGFIGGLWPYKGMNINKYLMPVLNAYNSIIYGWGGWGNHPKYRGHIKNEDVNVLLSSAKVCPSIVEPHTSRYGIDIPERMFKVPLGGGFTICDPVENLNRYISYDVFPTARNPNEYYDLVGYYCEHNDDRERLKRLQRHWILKNHTYLNRIQRILKICGYDKQAVEAQERVEFYVNSMV